MQSSSLLSSTLLIVQLAVSFASERPRNIQTVGETEMRQSSGGGVQHPSVLAPVLKKTNVSESLAVRRNVTSGQILADDCSANFDIFVLPPIHTYQYKPPNIHLDASSILQFLPPLVHIIGSVDAKEGSFQNLTTVRRVGECEADYLKNQINMRINVSLDTLQLVYSRVNIRALAFNVPLTLRVDVGENQIYMAAELHNAFMAAENDTCYGVITDVRLFKLEDVRIRLDIDGKYRFLSNFLSGNVNRAVTRFKQNLIPLVEKFVKDDLNNNLMPDFRKYFCVTE